ncbi:MAG: HAMP domain-containing protein, partial [Campylobacteraceae bacterium]|nr:HAMP domain-containing protein [Campylobacteraceae bacterium]
KQLETSFYMDKYDIFDQEGGRIGTISIFITDQLLKKELNIIITRTIIKTILISIMIILILFIIIRMFVLRPIGQLIKVSKEITAGHLDTSINVKGSTEIEQLSYNFRIMRDKIKDNIQDLEKKVHYRTEELEHSNLVLEQTIHNLKQTQGQLIEAEKMASLGSLVAGVAHEINTPVGMGITGITHFLDITRNLKKEYENNNMSEDVFKEYIDTSINLALSINTNLSRTASLIQSFKQVSVDQTSEGKREFDLREYLDDILLSINSVTKKTNLNINITCPRTIIMNSYPGVFSQIITNLIINSIHHAYEENQKGILTIELFSKGEYLHLIYKDDGCGIGQEILPKIFEPFFTTNREFGGTGLGLNIVYNIVISKLKGSIICESQRNKGVTFTIIVPLLTE